jgi:hypothetical protein
MKLHHTEYKKNYRQYILECLKTEDTFADKSPTDEELITYLFERFNSEFSFSIQQAGKHQALTEWLQGLAISIPFYYEDIIDLAIEMGSIEPEPRPLVINGYWSFMANVILSFEPKEHAA